MWLRRACAFSSTGACVKELPCLEAPMEHPQLVELPPEAPRSLEGSGSDSSGLQPHTDLALTPKLGAHTTGPFGDGP